jgi:hypothetical protein
VSLPVVTRPAAAAEIESAHRWYEKEREGLGAEFLKAVDKMVKVIAENRNAFPPFERIFAAQCCIAFHTASYTRKVSGQVVVIACFHGKRNPTVWRSRK